MLRTRVRRTTASTGVALTVTHGLGVTLDAWNIVACSARAAGRTYVFPALVGINTITIVNSLQTTCTIDVFAWAYQGRLY